MPAKPKAPADPSAPDSGVESKSPAPEAQLDLLPSVPQVAQVIKSVQNSQSQNTNEIVLIDYPCVFLNDRSMWSDLSMNAALSGAFQTG